MQQGLLNNGFWAKAQVRPRFERTFPKGSLFIVFLKGFKKGPMKTQHGIFLFEVGRTLK